MEENILRQIYECLSRGERAALVTITESTGSTPRKTGSIMAVFKDGLTQGSVGGGTLEYEVIKSAVECIKNGDNLVFEHKLNDNGELKMACGGETKGYIKLFKPRPRLLIAGAGHIGMDLCKIGRIAGFYTVVFDDRSEYANKERLPEADEIIVGDIGEKLSNYCINKDSYVVIVTRGHSSDGDALKAVVKSDAAYVGMIGSSKKVIHILKKMMDEGIEKELLEKVYTPIGIDIASEFPAEIAISIMSEILLVKNKGNLKHRKELRITI